MVLNLSAQWITILLVLILIWNVTLSIWVFLVWRHYNSLTAGVTKRNLSTVLGRILAKVKRTELSLTELDNRVEKLYDKSRTFIRKVRLFRYNPFKDVGGDQSFVIAFMDENNDGVVLSSLHSRESTRWFAKKIVEGRGVEHELSEEEQKVINE